MSLEVGQLRALAHPLRLQMLSLLTGANLSATEIARELDITQANASYHLRTLLDAGLIHVAEEEHVRGGLAKRYRHDVGSPGGGTSGDSSPIGDAVFVRALAAELVRRADARVDGPSHSTDADLWVAPEIWTDVVDRVSAAMLDLHQAAQAPRTEGTVRTSATVALFTMSDDR
jgi:DNA-binding transcriptional ArsR family regulator